MATCCFGHNSVEPGSSRCRVGFANGVTGRHRLAGNEGFTRTESFTDAEAATATSGACQHSVKW